MENVELNKEEWYDKTKQHWENSESTIKGVLGGNDQVNNSDVKTSSELLEGLIKTQKITPKRVIDCGAGIGRVTSNVLCNYFEECDILEQDEKFIEYCRNNLKGISCVKDIYKNSLQDFKFSKLYNVIWIQWCLENLDEEDLKNFLINCRNNLEENGLIIIKENIVTKGITFFDHDYSKVRSDIKFKEIFEKCSLKIIKHFHHPSWPKDLLKVSVYILENKKV